MKGITFFPEAASTVSTNIDLVYFGLVALTIIICVGVSIALVVMMIRYRRRSADEVGDNNPDNALLEITWTIIPLLLGIVIFYAGVGPYLETRRIPEDALQISVVGKQWMWKFQHPNGRKEINNLHIPVGRKIHLRMISEDVIHSVFIPAFRIKQDALPMYYTSIWFEPTMVGEFHLFCTEYCGEDHSVMGGKVTVMRIEDYEKWLQWDATKGPMGPKDFLEKPTTAVVDLATMGASGASASQAAPPPSSGANNTAVLEGKKLFTELTCVTCHAQKEGGIGPWLFGRYGSESKIEGGKKIKFDDNYIRESILNPMAKISLGYPPAMPPFKGRVSEEQILSLIAYIKAGSGQ